MVLASGFLHTALGDQTAGVGPAKVKRIACQARLPCAVWTTRLQLDGPFARRRCLLEPTNCCAVDTASRSDERGHMQYYASQQRSVPVLGSQAVPRELLQLARMCCSVFPPHGIEVLCLAVD